MHDGVRSSAWPFECGRALFLRVRSVAGIRVMSMMCAVRCVPVVCGGVLSVEVLSQITPTLQTRPGARRRETARARARRRERLSVWHRSARGRRTTPRIFDVELRKVTSVAFGRFRSLSAVGAVRPVPRCQDTPMSCSMRTRPRYATRRLGRQLATGPLPTDTRAPQTQCPQTGDRVVCAVSDGVTRPRTAPPGVAGRWRAVCGHVMCGVCGAAPRGCSRGVPAVWPKDLTMSE